MSSPCRASLLAVGLLVAGCDQQVRDPRGHPLPESGPLLGAVLDPAHPDPRDVHYDKNAYEVSQGQQYFRWMNCNGCHANGGGGMGPALSDSKWRYGSSMEDIVQTIANGRPNGMPSFAGKLTPQQMWQLAAYVRSLSQRVPQSIRAGRAEGLSVGEPSTLRDPQEPRAVTPKQDEATVE